MFGKELRRLIEKKYTSLAKYAEECDVSTGYLNDVLSGRTLPKQDKLKLFMEKLAPISEETKKTLRREWGFDKSNGILREDFREIEEKNKNMLEVLKSVKNEKALLKEIEELKEYEDFYNAFFKDLNAEETKNVLNAMVKELKVMSIGSSKSDILKEKFEKLEKLIDEIE